MANDRILKSGPGWRLGWQPSATKFSGLVGSDDWAVELTEPELTDFCRLLDRLVDSVRAIADELMPEEKIACEVESDRLWLGAEGYADAFGVRFVLLSGRGAEGGWPPEAVDGLVQAARTIGLF
ncbi:MAG: DUF1818 family protein [Limnothrix sp.]|uniref:DUF1818 family protein n=1 Tax=Limnothrix redekei LRLZ20PSL1 TaxID=3112953 RepID=A0ABW7CES6_9CYAN|nr:MULTISPECIES: DUF1818 family protein [unclassified Limnothrix]MEB3119116.1 DUF1818 family protein [Limnothrix sp.]OCQ93971.1 hypothetical protein BCR12_05455 [Limnothrix sp. P13C2]MBD2161308.1 DUF1818 family protein [Limnothrix sp. FACHB-1083]MBD2192180.1 DUF1818 family protein [Limnothrix sp. FACHB-1088]MBD2554733.1 DUF1818 family protein [Limnothrix sp. FACHB-708]